MDEDIFDENGALTAAFLLARGYCCGNGCRNCPYEPRHGGLEARPSERPAQPAIGPFVLEGATAHGLRLGAAAEEHSSAVEDEDDDREGDRPGDAHHAEYLDHAVQQ